MPDLPLSRQDIAEVRDSFAAVAAIADTAADLFYARLFAEDPAMRALFPADLTSQKVKLIKALTLAVGALDRPDDLAPVLRSLGARHAGYGVESRHYATVGFALLDTLAAGLGDRFTPSCRAAWTGAYALIAETMQAGAAETAADAA